MIQFLESFSALPNLHPAVVHFPVALALTALAFRFLQVLRPSLGRIGTSATILTTLSAVGGAAAWLAGRQAADSLGAISGAAESVLTRHADFAGWTVWLLAIAALLSLFLEWRSSRRGIKTTRFGGFLGLVALAGAVTIMMMTADLGGALVYRYGVAVATASDEVGPHERSPSAGDQATATAPEATPSDDGGPVWNHLSEGEMALNIDGTGLVALPGSFDDVIVKATIDPSRFQGRLALVHHVQSLTNWAGFYLDNEGVVGLIRLVEGDEKKLTESSLPFPREKTALRVSAVGGHLKGLMDGDVVVHGHGPSGEPGRVGLFFSGRGELKIIELSAESATSH